MMKRCSSNILLLLIVTLLILSFTLLYQSARARNTSRSRRAFKMNFKKFRFVPTLFSPKSANNFWSSQIIVDKQEKMLLCSPAGVSSYNLNQLLIRTLTSCTLPPASTFSEFNLRMAECFPNLPMYEHNTMRAVWNDSTWRKLALYGEPTIRFLWSFALDCVERVTNDDPRTQDDRCLGCGKDVLCFVDKLYDNYQTLIRTNKIEHFWMGIYSFYPQFWSCGFGHLYQQYERIDNRDESRLLPYVIRKCKNHGLPMDTGWGYTGKFSYENQTILEPIHQEKKLIRTLSANQVQLKKLVKIYTIDYLAFGFDLPTWITDACSECEQALEDAAVEYQEATKRHEL